MLLFLVRGEECKEQLVGSGEGEVHHCTRWREAVPAGWGAAQGEIAAC